MLFKNVCFYNEIFEKETADILVENGVIAEIGVINGEGRDMSGMIALPGFVDIHIHGGAGGDFSDASRNSLDKISLDDIKNALLYGDRAKAGQTMPPNGLYLKETLY